jgi:hypothetical protein
LLLPAACPSVIRADGCYGTASVSPTSGPIGTTFVFASNLGISGDPSTLRLYHNGALVRTVRFRGGGSHVDRYRIRTAASDVGEWQAVAANSPQCHTNTVRFSVTGLPASDATASNSAVSSAGAERSSDSAAESLLLAAGLIGGLGSSLLLRRRHGLRDRD